MKYIAPIEISKQLIDKLKPLGDLAAGYQDQKKQGVVRDNTNPKFVQIRELNRELKLKQQLLKKLKQSPAKQAEQIQQLEAEIQAITAEIKRLRNEIQQEVVNMPAEPSLNELKSQEADYKGRFREKFGRLGLLKFLLSTPSQDFSDSANTDNLTVSNEEQIDNLVQLLNFENNLLKVRNDLYINEYILTYFQTLVDQIASEQQAIDCEAEYILYGPGSGFNSPQAKAVQQLYGTRFALDSLAYFVFSKAAPPEFLLRTIYALIRGALQATIDTYKLLSDPSNTVGLVEMGTSAENPLAKTNLQLTYQDHLRLFMFIDALQQLEKGKKAKLRRIVQLIQRKNSLDATKAYTLLQGNAQASIKLWFFPLSGISQLSNGPFGAEIRQGRAYLEKSVELNY